MGDNDTLAAIVANATNADLLILLSDIDGLYTANPREDAEARLIPVVSEITPALEALAGGEGSALGTGGMVTKIRAAKMVTERGCDMVIMNGANVALLYDLLEGKNVGTRFLGKGRL